MYQADPNDSRKQIPRGLSAKAFSHAEIPAAGIVTKNPSYILINATGSFGFLYEATGSIGGTIDNSNGIYVSGSVVNTLDGIGLPIRLDINPRAWRRNDKAGTAGEITFIYRGQ